MTIFPSIHCWLAGIALMGVKRKEDNMSEPGNVCGDAISRRMTVGLMLALLIAALDSTVVATAMPVISASLGGAEHYAWPMTAYLLSSTVSMLLCGGIACSFGLKRVYAVGLVVFAASSALCAGAPTIEALAACRFLQGIGGGVLEAGVFIAAAMMVPPRDRGPYLGAASAMYGVANVVGPILGGAVAQGLFWHMIFLVNVPVAVVASVLTTRFLPEKSATGGVFGFDVLGSVAAAACVVSLTGAFSLVKNPSSIASPMFVALVVLCVASACALVRIEGGKDVPVVPMGLFRQSGVVAGFLSGFCIQFALMACVTYLPRVLQEMFGMSAASSGAALIPMTLLLVVGSNVSGAVFRATGRLRAIAGASSLIISGASVAFVIASSMLLPLSIVALSAVMGLGVGVGMPVSNLAAQTASEKKDAGRATSMAMFFRGLGGTVSTAVCGMLAPAASVADTFAVFCAACAVVLLGLLGSRWIACEIAS